jgi:hypothetical protein
MGADVPSYDTDLEGHHRRSIRHRQEVLASAICGCFYCRKTFEPSAIQDWVDEVDGVGQTALCPSCGIDAVLPLEHAGPASEELLRTMHEYWFS